jgi:hypothetical protein
MKREKPQVESLEAFYSASPSFTIYWSDSW